MVGVKLCISLPPVETAVPGWCFPLLLQHKLSLPPLREGDWGRGWGWGLDISWCSGERHIWLLQRGNVFLVGIRRAWRSNKKAVEQQIVLDASSNKNSDNNNS